MAAAITSTNKYLLDKRHLMDEVFWARIYAGFHFYHSPEAGRQLGETVAQGVVRNHFRAVKSDRDTLGINNPGTRLN